MSIAVLETEPGIFSDALPDTLESKDGERRAPLAVILPESWTEQERENFGVFLAVPAETPPAGQIVTATRYERIDGVVTQVLDTEDAPLVVPAEVTRRQLQLALLGAGLLDQVETFVESDSIPRAARISWKAAGAYYRNDAMLNEMAAHLTPPLSPAQIDHLFIAAAAIA